jgi:phosphoglycerate dehydrogenase-like enzyme
MLSYRGSAIWPSGRWNKFVPQPLRGATIGIVGYGSIGREVARLAKAFGMRVLACKRDTRQVVDEGYTVAGAGDPQGELPDRIYPSAALNSMVAECDVVVITAPLTEETHHMVDEEAFKAMKNESYLVNVSRGGVVDEKALLKALQKGWIAGAGLDVFEHEPLASDSPFWKMDNVIISPHVAGFTPHYDWRAMDLFVRNLRRYLEDRPLMNVVSRTLGY